MKDTDADNLIEINRDAYDKISKYFDQTRSYLWKELSQFDKYANDGDIILDFGCGNGRLAGLFSEKEISYVGVDASNELLNLARIKFKENIPGKINKVDFVTLDSLKIPFSDKRFNSVYSIAALHHIPTERRRIELLKEFNRILKPGGKIILTNWNLWQKKYINLVFKYAIKKIFGQHKADFKDVFVPWKDKDGNILANRYYHAFTMREFKRIVKKAGFNIVDSGYFKGKKNKANLYIVAEK